MRRQLHRRLSGQRSGSLNQNSKNPVANSPSLLNFLFAKVPILVLPVVSVLLFSSLSNAKTAAASASSVATVNSAASVGEKPAPAADPAAAKPGMKTATFAAGCFWGTEEFFRKIPGVVSTDVGYTGGTLANPKYEDTHDSKSGHAESVEVVYDPKKVSYEHLMDQFFKMHDPTTINRQGNDAGSQYRSAIFYHDDEQKKEAEAFVKKVNASHAWKAPIATEVAPAKKFWLAEDYHQHYLEKNPGGYDNHYLRPISFDKK